MGDRALAGTAALLTLGALVLSGCPDAAAPDALAKDGGDDRGGAEDAPNDAPNDAPYRDLPSTELPGSDLPHLDVVHADLKVDASPASDAAPPKVASQVASGWTHTCVSTGGELWCWGLNDQAQVGDGTTKAVWTPQKIISSGVSYLAAGRFGTCAVVNGGLWCWGRYGAKVQLPAPTQVGGLSSGVTKVSLNNPALPSSAEQFGCAIHNGGLKCWGDNNWDGKLGNGSLGYNTTVPQQVTGLTSGVTDVSAGGRYACAVHNGAAKCWGYNGTLSLLGSCSTQTNAPAPQQVSGLTSGVTSIAASWVHTCAVHGGAVKCWGFNQHGELGDGSVVNACAPKAAQVLTSGTERIALAHERSCAIKAGQVLCWGLNHNGESGFGIVPPLPKVPVPIAGFSGGVTSLSASYLHSCAVDKGVAKCWGLLAASETQGAQPVVGYAKSFSAVVAGDSYSCGVTTKGEALCWGKNDNGQLGRGDSVVGYTPQWVSGLTSGVSALAIGALHACAIHNGAAKCWGFNQYGELGDGTTMKSLVPRQVAGLTSGVTAIASFGHHSCAIHNGAAKCWGNNVKGGVGDGTTTDRYSPASVVGMTSGVSAIAVGKLHSCGVKLGAAWCWGGNDHGQLGSPAASTLPVAVLGLSGQVTGVAAGEEHTCALHAGALKCWGDNTAAQAGANHVPQIVAGLPVGGVTGVSAGRGRTCAHALSLGNAWCWANGAYPQPVAALKGLGTVTSIAVGGDHHCAVSGGTTSCWGDNSAGQLGLGWGSDDKPWPVVWP